MSVKWKKNQLHWRERPLGVSEHIIKARIESMEVTQCNYYQHNIIQKFMRLLDGSFLLRTKLLNIGRDIAPYEGHFAKFGAINWYSIEKRNNVNTNVLIRQQCIV